MIVQRLARFVETYRIAQRAGYIIYQTFRPSFSVKNIQKYWANKSLVNVPILSSGIYTLTSNNDSNKDSMTTEKDLIAKVDALFENKEYKTIVDILSKYKDNKDVELMWRHCRALYHMAKVAIDDEAKKLTFEAYHLIMEAYSINNNHWAVHKWAAILLDSKGNYGHKRQKFLSLHVFKQHLLESNKLNPNDATVLHMLGYLHFKVSNRPWIQRKFASIAFGPVPETSFEEALNYFEAAEKIEPLSNSKNLLLLGKTYLKLNRKGDAIKYLKLTAEYSARNDDDLTAKLEASKILETI